MFRTSWIIRLYLFLVLQEDAPLPSSSRLRTHRGERLGQAASKLRCPAPSGSGWHTSSQPGRRCRRKLKRVRGISQIYLVSTESGVECEQAILLPSLQLFPNKRGEVTREKSNKILCNKSLRPTCRCSPGPCSCSRRKERSVQLSCRSPSAKHAPECTGSHIIHESAENEKQTNLDEPSEWSQPSSRPNHYHGCLE